MGGQKIRFKEVYFYFCITRRTQLCLTVDLYFSYSTAPLNSLIPQLYIAIANNYSYLH